MIWKLKTGGLGDGIEKTLFADSVFLYCGRILKSLALKNKRKVKTVF